MLRITPTRREKSAHLFVIQTLPTFEMVLHTLLPSLALPDHNFCLAIKHKIMS